MVSGKGKHMRSIMRAIEAEISHGAGNCHTVTGKRADLNPLGICMRHVFLRLDIVFKVIRYFGFEETFVGSPSLIDIALNRASAEVAKLLGTLGHRELNTETGQGHLGLGTSLCINGNRNATLRKEGIGGLHLCDGHNDGSNQSHICYNGHALVGNLGNLTFIRLRASSVEVVIEPGVFNISVVIGRCTPDRGLDTGGKELLAVVNDRINNTSRFIHLVNGGGGCYNYVKFGLLALDSRVGSQAIKDTLLRLVLAKNKLLKSIVKKIEYSNDSKRYDYGANKIKLDIFLRL